MINRLWNCLPWIFAVAAMLAAIAWALTLKWPAGIAALLFALVTCVVVWTDIEDVPDMHPLDPHLEDLRRRLAMGKLQDLAPSGRFEDDSEQGW